MGTVVLAEEESIGASPEALFAMFGRCEAGWLFGFACDSMRAGAAVRFSLPMSEAFGGEVLEATGRIVALERPHRIVIEHETPWRGRITCTILADGERSRVRLVAEIHEDAIRWLLLRKGVELPCACEPGAPHVGLLVSQSGPGNVFAAASENVARLAVDEVNAEGGLGRRQLQLAVADDATSPAEGAAAVRRLIETDGCRVVVTNVTSATFQAVHPIAQQAGVLLIHSPVNEGGLTNGLLFRLGERPSDQVREAVPRLMADSGCRRWYLAGNDYCWPRATNQAVLRVVEQTGGVSVGERYEPHGSHDFAPVLEDIVRSGADLVVSTFVGLDEVAFEQQFFEAGLRERCRTIALAMDEATREHIGDRAAAGIWTVFGYFEQLSTPANAAFLDRYRRRFGSYSAPVSSISESVYETIHLATIASRRARSWDPVGVGRELAHAHFDGPRGPVSVAGPADFRQPLYLAEAGPSGFKILESVG